MPLKTTRAMSEWGQCWSGFCLVFKWLWICVFSFLVTSGSTPRESSEGGTVTRENLVAACSAPVFHPFESDSFIGSGFQGAALGCAPVKGPRTCFEKASLISGPQIL